MAKNVYIKLTKVSPSTKTFNIYDQFDVLIDENVPKSSLLEGMGYILGDDVIAIKLVSQGDCSYEKTMLIDNMSKYDFFNTPSSESSTGCVWRHLTNPTIFNKFYGGISPYIIEYPFAYEYYDQIVQNVKDYTKVYKYNIANTSNYVDRIETDSQWFNKAIVYNGQQCSGVLNLVAKPRRNLQQYMSYPIYSDDSKTITFTKSDNWYQYNTFWDIVKDKSTPIFLASSSNLSIDKEINQANMDYGMRSFTKSPIRGKESRIRHILDDRSDIQVVSRIIFVPGQISYK